MPRACDIGDQQRPRHDVPARMDDSPKAFEPGSSSAPALMATATFRSSELDDDSSDDDSFVHGSMPHRPAVQDAAAAPCKISATSEIREAGGAAAHLGGIAAATKVAARKGGLWGIVRCWSKASMAGSSPLAGSAEEVLGAAAHRVGAATATPESAVPGAAVVDVPALGGGSGPGEAAPPVGEAAKRLAAAAERAGAMPSVEGVFAPKIAFAFLVRSGVKKSPGSPNR